MIKKKYIAIILCIVIIGCITTYWTINTSSKETLPIFTAEFFPGYLSDNSKNMNTHFIQDFSFKNQLNQRVTQKILDDKITVVSFFYANCTLVCPTIIRKLQTVQKNILDKNNIQILSITITPSVDTPAVLKSYANENHIHPDKWQLLTGNIEDTVRFARESFFGLTPDQNKWNQNIHSETLFLVDSNKQIRGIYNATQTNDIKNLIADIYLLSKKNPRLIY